MTFEEWCDEGGFWNNLTRLETYVEELAHGCRAKDIKEALEEAFDAGFAAGAAFWRDSPTT